MTSRRSSARWSAGSSASGDLAIEVLIPTADRPAELTATLAGLAAQDDPPFRVRVSDQSLAQPVAEVAAVAAMLRVLEAQGRPVTVAPHLPRRGVAEQRDFLLRSATADAVLFLDDDVWLEPGALARLHDALATLACGARLLETGGFSFWHELPAEHAGEDVLAQWRVMERYGGAGILPSGAVHLEAPTTLPARTTQATDLLPPDA